MRLAMFPSSPALEDDHYRYLWDSEDRGHGPVIELLKDVPGSCMVVLWRPSGDA